MEWRVQVPENEVYALRIKGRQNIKGGSRPTGGCMWTGPFLRGGRGHRFSLLAGLAARNPGTGWGARGAFAAESGEHTLRLEVVPGPLAGAVEQLRGAMSGLNEAYRQIVMVTGVNPDKNRDYALDELIPGLMEALRAGQQDLLEQKSALEQLSGQRQGTNSPP